MQLPGSLELLEGAERGLGIARFLAVERPAVLLGRRQQATVLDLRSAGRLGWDILQRITPGGLVYMDRAAICLELVLPASHSDFTPDVVAATRWFGGLFVRALHAIGVKAELAPANSPPAAGLAAQACFASWVRGEVLVEGRKVFGTAQYRRRGGALFQGVGLITGSHGRVAAVLPGEEQARREAAAVIERMSAPVGMPAQGALEDEIRRSVARAGIRLA